MALGCRQEGAARRAQFGQRFDRTLPSGPYLFWIKDLNLGQQSMYSHQFLVPPKQNFEIA